MMLTKATHGQGRMSWDRTAFGAIIGDSFLGPIHALLREWFTAADALGTRSCVGRARFWVVFGEIFQDQ